MGSRPGRLPAGRRKLQKCVTLQGLASLSANGDADGWRGHI